MQMLQQGRVATKLKDLSGQQFLLIMMTLVSLNLPFRFTIHQILNMMGLVRLILRWPNCLA